MQQSAKIARIPPLKKTNFALIAAFLLIAFHVWHNTTRRIWNFSVLDSLTIGGNTIELSRQTHPTLEIKSQYDGQFFYALAHDPLLVTDKVEPYLDTPYYRARRVLYPLVSHVLALGRPAALPYTLLIVNIFAWIAAGAAAFRIAQPFGKWAGWAAFGCLVNSGLTFSTFRSMADPLAIALCLWGSYFWFKDRRTSACALLSLAVLAREASVVVPAALLFYELVYERRSFKSVATHGTMVIALPLVWVLYLKFRLPNAPDIDRNMISFPFVGMYKDFLHSREILTTNTERIRTYSMWIAGLLIMGLAVFRYRKFPTQLGTITLFQAIFCSMVYGTIWSYHASSCRAFLPLMVFALLWLFENAGHLLQSGKVQPLQ